MRRDVTGRPHYDRSKAFDILHPLYIHWVALNQNTAEAMDWLETELGLPARIFDGTWVWVDTTCHWYHQNSIIRFKDQNMAFEFRMRFG